jgi:aryl-alcohol dehydrogenase-like predicted oxidoreductase
LGPFSVSAIGFGAMRLPGPGAFGPPKDHDEALAVLREAGDRGVDHIDPPSSTGRTS